MTTRDVVVKVARAKMVCDGFDHLWYDERRPLSNQVTKCFTEKRNFLAIYTNLTFAQFFLSGFSKHNCFEIVWVKLKTKCRRDYKIVREAFFCKVPEAMSLIGWLIAIRWEKPSAADVRSWSYGMSLTLRDIYQTMKRAKRDCCLWKTIIQRSCHNTPYDKANDVQDNGLVLPMARN